MGKYSGKVLTVFITPSGVRVCEGENKNGNPDIPRFFVVNSVSDYFSNSSSRAPEIINMAGLVAAIVEECRTQHCTARRVMVCSDCFGIETTLDLKAGGGGVKSLASGDVKAIFSSLRGKSSEPKVADQMVTKVQWGEVAIDGQLNGVTTRTIGDRYLLKSLVDTFYEHGYEVIYVSGAQEVLYNFWQTEPANFDSQGKIILDYDVECRTTVFFKDVPVEHTVVGMIDREDLIERMLSQIRASIPKTQRNPHIYLAGSTFYDPSYYGFVMSRLEAEGFMVYDLFGCGEVDEAYMRRVEEGTAEPILTPDYSANVAMLMAPYSKQLISLTPQIAVEDVLRKNSKTVAKLGLGISGAAFAVALVLAGLRCWDLYQMNTNPSNLDSLQNQVTQLTMRQSSLNSTIQTLTEADTTVLELMKFIRTNQSDRVSVVSIDTRDMLGDSVTVDNTASTAPADSATDPSVSGSVGGGTTIRENIVIRGYAKSGSEAVGYYDKLFNYGLTGDPVLNGVERYILPDGDEVYIFEIEIMGGGL